MEKKGCGKTWTAVLKSKSTETQELTVIQKVKEWLAAVADGKLPANQKTEG